MAFQLKQLVPCLCIILSLLSNISFSHAKERPCRGYSDQGGGSNYIIDDAVIVFLLDKVSGRLAPTLRNNLSDVNANNTRVLSLADFNTWQDRPDGLGVDEATFSVKIVFRQLQNQSPSGLAFLIIPVETFGYLEQTNASLAEKLFASPLQLTDPTARTAFVSSVYAAVSAAIGMLVGNPAPTDGYHGEDSVVGVVIDIDPGTRASAASNYSVWIDCDGVRLSVYVDAEGRPKPANAITDAQLNMKSVVSHQTYKMHAVQ